MLEGREGLGLPVLACLTGAPLAPGSEATMEVQSRRPQEVERRIRECRVHANRR